MKLSFESERPLDFKCPCGYTKKLPARYEGQRIVCPDCRTVIRIEKIRLPAELVVRCPYCKHLHPYEDGLSGCSSCKKKFDVPAGQLRRTPDPQDQQAEDIVESAPLVNVSQKSSRNRRASPVVPGFVRSLISIVSPSILIFVIWYGYGDALGLPSLPWKQSAEPDPVRVVSEAASEKAVKTKPVKTKPSKIRRNRTPSVGENDALPAELPGMTSSAEASTENNPTSSTASPESDNVSSDDVPVLPSGKLDVVNASFAVERSDIKDSEDRAPERLIKVEVKNNSEQAIDSFRFNVFFYDDQGKKRGARSGARAFDSPLEPGVTQDVEIALRSNTEINELVVEILSTRSGGQTDSMPTVRKFILGQ